MQAETVGDLSVADGERENQRGGCLGNARSMVQELRQLVVVGRASLAGGCLSPLRKLARAGVILLIGWLDQWVEELLAPGA